MGAKTVRHHEAAADDIKEAVAFYIERSTELANDFVAELNRAAETIAKAPRRWPEGANNTRRFLLWRFPFALIYSEQESIITIWAVAHGRQTTGVLV